jgi:asparagine synthase (glutamine-hydrolysing)
MSDAVGHSWVSYIRDYANKHISDIDFEQKITKYTHNTPVSKEELLYRQLYEKHYGNIDLLPHIWRPKYTNILDPSAAMLDNFKDTIPLDEQ